jgi:hypothetical protein
MEAKEKAEKLVLKFLRIENNTPEWFNTHIAKQCAMIAQIILLEKLKDLNIEDSFEEQVLFELMCFNK